MSNIRKYIFRAFYLNNKRVEFSVARETLKTFCREKKMLIYPVSAFNEYEIFYSNIAKSAGIVVKDFILVVNPAIPAKRRAKK